MHACMNACVHGMEWKNIYMILIIFLLAIFVKGDRTVYETNVIADTAHKPGKPASYSLTVPIKKGRKAEYHTMDIRWEQTK